MRSKLVLSTMTVLALCAGDLVLTRRAVRAAATLLVPSQYATIQAAVNAAATGDLILISPGTYKENITITNKMITLASLFHTTGDHDYVAQTILDGKNGPYCVRVQPTRVPTFVGLTLQNADDGVRATGKFRFIDCRVTRTNDGIDYEGGSGGLILRSIFDHNNDDGIDFDNEVNALVLENTIRDNGDDGIEIRVQPYFGPRLWLTIKHNVIARNGEDGIQIISSNVATTRTIQIEGNQILDNAMAGIGMMCCENTIENYQGANILEQVGIYNNTISGNDHGITGGDSAVVLNNLILNSTRIGMKNVNAGSHTAHNLFWGNGTDIVASTVDSATTLWADPQLRPDLSPASWSPACDAGTGEYEKDGVIVWERDASLYQGPAPDLGAIENLDVLDAPQGATRERVTLAPPVPNPSAGWTRLRAHLPRPSRVRLEIVDVSGRRVRLLADSDMGAGAAEWSWDGRDTSGARAAAGVYFARLHTPAGLEAQRLVKIE